MIENILGALLFVTLMAFAYTLDNSIASSTKQQSPQHACESQP